MNVYSDLGVSNDVWETQQPSKSIADVSFVPTSVAGGIELTNDYEPVVYQANRALMTANAAQEINDLQLRNHATTAYSTLDCVATPLFPTFNAQRGMDCVLRQRRQEEGINRIVPHPEYNLVAQPEPPIGYKQERIMGEPGFYKQGGWARTPHSRAEVARGPVSPIVDVGAGLGAAKESFGKKMVKSVRGSAYDLAHLKELPADSTKEAVVFAVTRDDRTGYLLLWVTLVVLMITLVGLAVGLK
jgi:hypothetical protein